MSFYNMIKTSLIFWLNIARAIALLETPSNVGNGNLDKDVFQILNTMDYLPNEEDLPKSTVVKNVDNDATYILSKLSDEELIKLLSQEPKRNEYDLTDLVRITSNGKGANSLNSYDKLISGKGEVQGAFFKLDDKEVEPFNYNNDADPKYNALQKLNSLLYSRPQQNSEEDDEKNEMLFDALVAQLKTLCCKKSKPKTNTMYKLKSLLKKIMSQKKSMLLEKNKVSLSTASPKEHIFLIINDEIKSHNVSDELVAVDPDSLSKNSSVLLLGPITTPLSDVQLKLVMSRIANELSKPEYLPLLQKISEGALGDNNLGLMKSLVTGLDSRRYIKPHRCNHQSKLARVYGGPKWLICTAPMEANIVRCGWVNEDPIYITYHDQEWGKPEYDNINLFEMMCLEGQQAGLSWLTVLKKRDNYRKVFCDFDPYKILKLTENDVQEFMITSGIIKHRGKINAIINNAKCYIEMDKNGEDFSVFVWNFVNNKPILNSWRRNEEIPSQTSLSVKLSTALKKKGFKFVGPTICYSFMQACGLVNDHIKDCICYKKYR